MPGIKKRKGGAGWIGGEGLDEDDFDDGRPPRKILLCPHCIEYNFKNPLHHKILMEKNQQWIMTSGAPAWLAGRPSLGTK